MDNNNNNNNRPTRAWSSADSRIRTEINRLVEERSQLLRNIADMNDERQVLYNAQRCVAEEAIDSYDDVELYDMIREDDGKVTVTLRLSVDFGKDEDLIFAYLNTKFMGSVYSADRKIARMNDEVEGINRAIQELENYNEDMMIEKFIDGVVPYYVRKITRPITLCEESN